MGTCHAEPWLSPKLRLSSVPDRGHGLVATQAIEREEVVIVWGGSSYCDRIAANEAEEKGLPTMQWDEDLYSVEGDHHPAFAINHSCDPNVWLQDAFTLVARRAIGTGEEATVDYATFISDEARVPEWRCSCGSPMCRHTIRGRDWLIPDLQAAYRGHFSPLIQRRIDENVVPKEKLEEGGGRV